LPPRRGRFSFQKLLTSRKPSICTLVCASPLALAGPLVQASFEDNQRPNTPMSIAGIQVSPRQPVELPSCNNRAKKMTEKMQRPLHASDAGFWLAKRGLTAQLTQGACLRHQSPPQINLRMKSRSLGFRGRNSRSTRPAYCSRLGCPRRKIDRWKFHGYLGSSFESSDLTWGKFLRQCPRSFENDAHHLSPIEPDN